MSSDVRTNKLLRDCNVERVTFTGTYLTRRARARVAIVEDGGLCSVEQYVRGQFSRLGYATLAVENESIHVLVAPVLQDPD